MPHPSATSLVNELNLQYLVLVVIDAFNHTISFDDFVRLTSLPTYQNAKID